MSLVFLLFFFFVCEANPLWCEHVFNFVFRFAFLRKTNWNWHTSKVKRWCTRQYRNESANKNEDEYKIEQTRHTYGTSNDNNSNKKHSHQIAMGAENRHKFIPFVWKCAEAELAYVHSIYSYVSIDRSIRIRFMCFDIFAKVNLWGPNDNSLSQSSNQSVDMV